MLKVLEKSEELDFLLQRNLDKKILVKFFLKNCRPCQQLQVSIEEEKLTEKSDLIVVEIDAEKFPELASSHLFKVWSVPALFLFKKGLKVREKRSYLNKEELQEFINV